MIYIHTALLWSVCQEVHWVLPVPSWANPVPTLVSGGDTLKKYFLSKGVQGFLKAAGGSGMASERK